MAIATRALGKTGNDVTILGYGAMELRGEPRGPKIDEADAERLLNGVLDGGINLIDTSIDYGHSEELIGKYISHRRDEYFLASKCACLVGPRTEGVARPGHDFSRENVRAGVEQSLRRLNTDHLDLVQVHSSPSRDELESNGTVEEMKALQAEGKVRFLGMSGTIPNLTDHIAMDVFDVFQIPYSALQRDHEDLITEAVAAGAGTLIRGGAARGAPSEDKGWSTSSMGLSGEEGRSRWEAAGLDDLLDGMSRIEFVLRFTLSHPGLSSTIVGTSNPDHLASNLAVAEKGVLADGVYEEAKRRLTAAGSAPAI